MKSFSLLVVCKKHGPRDWTVSIQHGSTRQVITDLVSRAACLRQVRKYLKTLS
jgi:hypothetical protein